MIDDSPVSDTHLPLTTLLSHALVAFTIEFDNEFEHQMPHRTTRFGGTSGAPWLVSLAMDANCMQFVGEDGITVADLEHVAHTKTNLDGMRRWGYVTLEPTPPRATSLMRATPAGRQAQAVWRPLFGVIEQRWRERFGSDQIDSLRQSLSAIVTQLDPNLPDCLPILGYGFFSRPPNPKHQPSTNPVVNPDSLPLSALLSKVLLTFAIEFERESPDLSLALSANVVRVLDEKGVLTRDLPRLTGTSKEAISGAVNYLKKFGFAIIELDPASASGRDKIIRLTPKGQTAQNSYQHRLGVIERRWRGRFGKDLLRALKDSLMVLDSAPDAQQSPLFRGLQPYPDGWRARRQLEVLPDFPFVLHRGGFPDGS